MVQVSSGGFSVGFNGHAHIQKSQNRTRIGLGKSAAQRKRMTPTISACAPLVEPRLPIALERGAFGIDRKEAETGGGIDALIKRVMVRQRADCF